jgi:chorismate mutase
MAVPAAEGDDEESRRVMQACFDVWSQDARYKPRRTCLASYINPSFMLTLEESALKDALREFLQMLVYVDRIRNFALLNSLVAMKLAQCHCGNKTEEVLTKTLHALPMFKMEVLSDLVPEIEGLARKLHDKLRRRAAVVVVAARVRLLRAHGRQSRRVACGTHMLLEVCCGERVQRHRLLPTHGQAHERKGYSC